MDQRVVRCHAGLAGVGQFAEDDAVEGAASGMPWGHDHRAFAAQFKGQRHKVVTRRPHYHPANLGTAGEQ
ncbi:hypothetical protein D3C76_1867920 [compost metagenome]